MKLFKIKSIEILTDGSIYFSYLHLQSGRQTIFYEKDNRTFMLSKKTGKKQSVQNLQQNFYKTKYRT